jgi:hypothetical protein
VQPSCQQKTPDFIGFYERDTAVQENPAGPIGAHPAI